MWGLFCVYNRSSRGVFVLIVFLGISFITDIIFMSIWSYGSTNVLMTDDTAGTHTHAIAAWRRDDTARRGMRHPSQPGRSLSRVDGRASVGRRMRASLFAFRSRLSFGF